MPLLPRQAQDGSGAESGGIANHTAVVAASTVSVVVFSVLLGLAIYRYRSRISLFRRLNRRNSWDARILAGGQDSEDQCTRSASNNLRGPPSHDWDPAGMFATSTPRESMKDVPLHPPITSPPSPPPAKVDSSQDVSSALAVSGALSARRLHEKLFLATGTRPQGPVPASDREGTATQKNDVERREVLMTMKSFDRSSSTRTASRRSTSSFDSRGSSKSSGYHLPPCPMSRSYEAIDLGEGIDLEPLTSLSPPPPFRSPSIRELALSPEPDLESAQAHADTSAWTLIGPRPAWQSMTNQKPYVDDSLLAAAALAWWEASGTRSSPEQRRRYSQLGERKRIESSFGLPAAVIAATWRRDSGRLSGMLGAAAGFNSGIGASLLSSPTIVRSASSSGAGSRLSLTHASGQSLVGPNRTGRTSGIFGPPANWQHPIWDGGDGDDFRNNSNRYSHGGADDNIDEEDENEPLPTDDAMALRDANVTAGASSSHRILGAMPKRPEAARTSRAQKRLSKHRYQHPIFYNQGNPQPRKARGEELADRRHKHSRWLPGSSSKPGRSTPEPPVAKESRPNNYVLELSHDDKGFNFGFEF